MPDEKELVRMVLHHTEHISKETYSKAKYTSNIQIHIYDVKPYLVIKTRNHSNEMRQR